jgi:hypothetical protein
LQVTVFDPNGAPVLGQYLKIDDTRLSPDSNPSNAQSVLTFIYNALARAVPFGIGSDIQDAIVPFLPGMTSGGPPNNNYVYADWATCKGNSCFGDHEHGLYLAFDMRVGDQLPGTYQLYIYYHAEITECFNFNGNCNGTNLVTQDVHDYVLDCYIKCSSNGAVFMGQSPSNTQTATSTPTQTTYLDSQNPTTTHGSSQTVYVKTASGQLQYSLLGLGLPSLPANSYATSATLQFNVNSVAPNPFFLQCHGGSGPLCQLSISQISSSWDANSATWNSPPSTTGNQKFLFSPSLGTANADVTGLVKAAYASGNFYGFEFRPYDTTEVWQIGIVASGSQAPSLTVKYVTYTSPPATMCAGSSATVSITMSNPGKSNWISTASGEPNPSKLESQNPENNNYWGISTIELAQTVLWYQSYTFSFNAIAPMVPGTYNFQWRMYQQGVGAFGDYTPNVVVNVVNCPDFSISANPSSISMNQYTCWPSTITVSSLSGFSGTVTLSASSSPSIAESFSGCGGPAGSTAVTVPAGGSATATLTFDSCNASPGSYPTTVTATSTSPSLSHPATISVTVVPYSSSCLGGGGASLAYGTLITIANGSRVPVQSLKVGDQMLGYDPTTGQYQISTVTSVVIKQATNMLIINTGTGTPLRVDASLTEVLWTKLPDGSTLWLPAPQLKVGDDLWTQNGWVAITSINFAPAGNHTMWDITATAPYFASGYLDPPHPS